jgi:hypothetical protein
MCIKVLIFGDQFIYSPVDFFKWGILFPLSIYSIIYFPLKLQPLLPENFIIHKKITNETGW